MEGKQTSEVIKAKKKKKEEEEVIKANTQDHGTKNNGNERTKGRKEVGGGQGRRGKKYKESKVNFFSSENSFLKLPISICTLCKRTRHATLFPDIENAFAPRRHP